MKSYITIAGAVMLGGQVEGLSQYYPTEQLYRMDYYQPQVQQDIQIGSLDMSGDGSNVITGNNNVINNLGIQVQSPYYNTGATMIQQQQPWRQVIQYNDLAAPSNQYQSIQQISYRQPQPQYHIEQYSNYLPRVQSNIDIDGSVISNGYHTPVNIQGNQGSTIGISGDVASHGGSSPINISSDSVSNVDIGGSVETTGNSSPISFGSNVNVRSTINISGNVASHGQQSPILIRDVAKVSMGPYPSDIVFNGGIINNGAHNQFAIGKDSSNHANGLSVGLNIAGGVYSYGKQSDINLGGDGIKQDSSSNFNINGGVGTYGRKSDVNIGEKMLNVGLSIGGAVETYGNSSNINFGGDAIKQDSSSNINIGGQVQTYGQNSNVNLGTNTSGQTSQNQNKTINLSPDGVVISIQKNNTTSQTSNTTTQQIQQIDLQLQQLEQQKLALNQQKLDLLNQQKQPVVQMWNDFYSETSKPQYRIMDSRRPSRRQDDVYVVLNQ